MASGKLDWKDISAGLRHDKGGFRNINEGMGAVDFQWKNWNGQGSGLGLAWGMHQARVARPGWKEGLGRGVEDSGSGC